MSGARGGQGSGVVPALLALGLLLAGGAGVFLALRDAPGRPPMTADTADLMARFEALDAGTLSPAEVAELTSRAVAVRHHVRPRIGREQWLVVEREVELALPPTYELDVLTRVEVDGVLQRATHHPRRYAGEGSSTAAGHYARTRHAIDPVLATAHQLAPGRHRVRISSELMLLKRGQLVHLDDVLTSHDLLVEAAPPLEDVALTAPEGFDPARIDVRVSPRTDGSGPGLLTLQHGPLPIALAGALVVSAPDGRELARASVVLRPGAPGWFGVPLDLSGLAAGDALRVRLEPDRALALEGNATVHAIYGQPLERTVPAPPRAP